MVRYFDGYRRGIKRFLKKNIRISKLHSFIFPVTRKTGIFDESLTFVFAIIIAFFSYKPRYVFRLFYAKYIVFFPL